MAKRQCYENSVTLCHLEKGEKKNGLWLFSTRTISFQTVPIKFGRLHEDRPWCRGLPVPVITNTKSCFPPHPLYASATSYSAPRFHWVKCLGNPLVIIQTTSAFFKCRSRLWHACEITSVISSLQTGICCFQYSTTSNNTQDNPSQGASMPPHILRHSQGGSLCQREYTCFHLLVVCVCCVSVCICVCNSHAHRGQRTTSAIILRSCLLRQGISLDCSSIIRLDCLANKPVSTPSAEITSIYHHVWFFYASSGNWTQIPKLLSHLLCPSERTLNHYMIHTLAPRTSTLPVLAQR